MEPSSLSNRIRRIVQTDLAQAIMRAMFIGYFGLMASFAVIGGYDAWFSTHAKNGYLVSMPDRIGKLSVYGVDDKGRLFDASDAKESHDLFLVTLKVGELDTPIGTDVVETATRERVLELRRIVRERILYKKRQCQTLRACNTAGDLTALEYLDLLQPDD